MKKTKKILSAVAVLALSAVTACAAFAGCKKDDNGEGGNDYNEYGSTYYVSPDAKNSGTGAKNDPMNIARLLGGNILKPGDTVLVQPGVYKLSEKIQMRSSGTYNHNITIKNAGESGEKAVLDFSEMTFLSTNRGVELYANYVYWYGVDICGAGDNGMYIGGSYNTVEYCEFYNNRDTGLQIGRQESGHVSINQWPSYNLIKNCTSHNNYDNETYGENADGFAAKLTVGYGNVFDGCVAYRNSDDGWDLYAKDDSGNIGQVIIYNCVAFENGYIEYTQEEYNALFPNFNKSLAESDTNSYVTRDGDGNGFKLGGSVMEGDVVVYNSLSFNNRMHGVTDNSNPGYLYLEGVTSYNNSAAIDRDPESPTFGQIIAVANHDEHNNIDVARQTYSYNTVRNSLSVTDSYAKSLGTDEYRGSVTDSVLLGSGTANKIVGSIDADTRNEGQLTYTEQTAALVSTDVFAKLPFVKDGDNYVHNISGLRDMGDFENGQPTSEDRVHHKYRNADGSINMGEILAVKDYSKLLGEDKKIGSVLNKSEWSAYEHFTEGQFSESVTSSIAATLEKAKETLYITADADSIYQNFDVPTKLLGCAVSWTSSDEEVLKIGQDYDESRSGSEYVKVDVTRPTDGDRKVKLTATISFFNRSVVKEIEVNVKKDEPKVGSLYVVVDTTGEVIENDGTIIFDRYQQFEEPTVKVTNGAYKAIQLDNPELKELKPEQYDLTTKYEYATEDGKPYKTVAAYTPNVAGVFRITHTVTLKGDASSSNTMSYKIFVASTDADLDWAKYETATDEHAAGDPIASVSVNRLGFIIGGSPNSAIGHLYAFATTEKIENVTADAFYTVDGDEKVLKDNVIDHSFRATSIEYQYENPNNGAYYIYYALANGKEIITSQVYEVEVKIVDIDTVEKFSAIAHGNKVASEDPSQTIYMLTECLDLSSQTNWNPSGKFTGVLNGNGHTVSNLTIEGAGIANGKASMFYEVSGGSIMNIKFDNITLKSTGSSNGQKVGIIGTCYGGYFYNIQITNVDFAGTQRVAGLIAQLNQGTDTFIEKVSVVNSDSTKKLSGLSAGGIIGLIQIPSTAEIHRLHVSIYDCYTNLEVGSRGADSRYSGGIVGRYDSQIAGYDYLLDIKSCWSACSLYAGYNSAGGILGAQQGSGKLNIVNSMFTGELYHAYSSGEPIKLETSQKNSSGMIGGFVATADVTIKNCISVIAEYNPDYTEEVSVEYVYGKLDLLQGRFEEGTWNYHFAEGSDTTLEAPYISLNFGTWECECDAE